MSDRRLFKAPRSRLIHLIVGLLSFALLTGCGDGKIARYPVSGTVMVKGQPYEGARVFLFPIGGDEAFQRERPFGVTDANGRFELTTFQKGDGAPAGEYTAIFRNSSPSNAEQAKAWARRPKIAKQYGKPELSPVKVTITTDSNELDPFDLEPATRKRR